VYKTEDESMTNHDKQAVPLAIKRSRVKIWPRTGILAVFATLFALASHRDTASIPNLG
jgi:hypothetical protein